MKIHSMANAKENGSNSGADWGFEATLWAVVDKSRNKMPAAVYKHVVLSLNLLRDSIEIRREGIGGDLILYVRECRA
jgi:hypothetical protein